MDSLHTNIANHVEGFFTSDWSFFYGFLKDFILPGLAIYMAYFIFIKQTKQDRKDEEDKKGEERQDKLIYFSTLVKAIIMDSITQKDYIAERNKKIEEDDINFHLMNSVVLNDFKRVTEILSLEAYLLAYANYYNKDRIASIQEFKKIVKCVDVLYEIFKGIPRQLDVGQKCDHERKKEFATLFAKGKNLVDNIMRNSQGQNTPLCKDIEKLLRNFDDNYSGNNYDLTFVHNYFFIPFYDFAVKYLNETLNDTKELKVITRDGKQVYSYIKSENRRKVEEFTGDLKAIDETILSLQQSSARLLADF